MPIENTMIDYQQDDLFRGKTILLGITGSIAAYKAAYLVRKLKELNSNVIVVMTNSSQKFITPLTLRVLSQNEVYTDLFSPNEKMAHLSLDDTADLILIAPATANIISKMSNGIADDLLSTILLASRKKIIFAPAMYYGMWTNRITQRNIQRLKEIGVGFIEPETGKLASGIEGVGRLASEEKILSSLKSEFAKTENLKGETVLVTAGPTQEPIDVVRYISNRSSGKMGYAIAEAARDRSANVILITGPTNIQAPTGVRLIRVKTADEMSDAVIKQIPESTILIMSAAVADFRVEGESHSKIKKNGKDEFPILLKKNPDILIEVSKVLKKDKKKMIIVGFAAETDDLIKNSIKKLKEKNLDFIVGNDVSSEGVGFDSDYNAVKIIDKRGNILDIPKTTKHKIADILLDTISDSKINAHG